MWAARRCCLGSAGLPSQAEPSLKPHHRSENVPEHQWPPWLVTASHAAHPLRKQIPLCWNYPRLPWSPRDMLWEGNIGTQPLCVLSWPVCVSSKASFVFLPIRREPQRLNLGCRLVRAQGVSTLELSDATKG